MMDECPKCGSTEIMPDLVLWTNYDSDRHITYVALDNPKKKRDFIEVGFRADVCGACGCTEMHTNSFSELRAAWNNGFKSRGTSRAT